MAKESTLEQKIGQSRSSVVTKTSDGKFLCPECGKTFEQIDVANEHLHKEHWEHLKTAHKEVHGKDINKQHNE